MFGQGVALAPLGQTQDVALEHCGWRRSSLRAQAQLGPSGGAWLWKGGPGETDALHLSTFGKGSPALVGERGTCLGWEMKGPEGLQMRQQERTWSRRVRLSEGLEWQDLGPQWALDWAVWAPYVGPDPVGVELEIQPEKSWACPVF